MTSSTFVILEGWLKQKVDNNFRDVYVVLTSELLSIYDTQSSYRNKPKDTVRTIRISANHHCLPNMFANDFSMQIFVKGEKSNSRLTLKASNQDDFELWMKQLEELIKRCKENLEKVETALDQQKNSKENTNQPTTSKDKSFRRSVIKAPETKKTELIQDDAENSDTDSPVKPTTDNKEPLNDLTKEIDKLNKNLTSEKNHSESLSKKYSNLNTEYNKQNNKLKQLERSNQELESEMKKLKLTHKDSTDSQSKIELQLKQLIEENEKLKKDKNELESIIKKKPSSNIDSNKIVELENEKKQLELYNNNIEKQLENMNHLTDFSKNIEQILNQLKIIIENNFEQINGSLKTAHKEDGLKLDKIENKFKSITSHNDILKEMKILKQNIEKITDHYQKENKSTIDDDFKKKFDEMKLELENLRNERKKLEINLQNSNDDLIKEKSKNDILDNELKEWKLKLLNNEEKLEKIYQDYVENLKMLNEVKLNEKELQNSVDKQRENLEKFNGLTEKSLDTISRSLTSSKHTISSYNYSYLNLLYLISPNNSILNQLLHHQLIKLIHRTPIIDRTTSESLFCTLQQYAGLTLDTVVYFITELLSSTITFLQNENKQVELHESIVSLIKSIVQSSSMDEKDKDYDDDIDLSNLIIEIAQLIQYKQHIHIKINSKSIGNKSLENGSVFKKNSHSPDKVQNRDSNNAAIIQIFNSTLVSNIRKQIESETLKNGFSSDPDFDSNNSVLHSYIAEQYQELQKQLIDKNQQIADLNLSLASMSQQIVQQEDIKSEKCSMKMVDDVNLLYVAGKLLCNKCQKSLIDHLKIDPIKIIRKLETEHVDLSELLIKLNESIKLKARTQSSMKELVETSELSMTLYCRLTQLLDDLLQVDISGKIKQKMKKNGSIDAS